MVWTCPRESCRVWWRKAAVGLHHFETDHVIEHHLSDMVFLDKQQGKCHLIDIAISGDARIEENEKERLEKYQD